MTLTVAPGSQLKYAEVMREARVVKLKEIGIENIRCRKSMTRAMIIEVPGKDNQEKADKLPDKLRKVFGDSSEVRIGRSEKRAEIRITDQDNSVTAQDVIESIALHGEYRPEQISVGEIRRPTGQSMDTV